jgi:Short C-terminal domain
MFRRRFVIVRRPRLLGAALIGGLGFAAGRASKNAAAPGVQPGTPSASSPELTARLKEVSDLHAAGSLTDEEFAAAKARLLR